MALIDHSCLHSLGGGGEPEIVRSLQLWAFPVRGFRLSFWPLEVEQKAFEMDRHLNSCQGHWQTLQPHSWAAGGGGGSSTFPTGRAQAAALSTWLLPESHQHPPRTNHCAPGPQGQHAQPQSTVWKHSQWARSVCRPHSRPCENLPSRNRNVCFPSERVCNVSSCNPNSGSGISQLGCPGKGSWRGQKRAGSPPGTPMSHLLHRAI